jgi:hypothetical protein
MIRRDTLVRVARFRLLQRLDRRETAGESRAPSRGALQLRALVAALVLTLSPAPPLGAQGNAPMVDTPERVAKAAFDARQARNWAEFLQLTHPAAVHRFKRDIVTTMTSTLSQLGSSRVGRAQHQLLEVLFNVESVDELKALPADTLLTRYMAYVYRDTNDGRDVARSVWSQTKIVGQVFDGDTVAYVIIKRPWPTARADPMESLTIVSEPQPVVDVLTLKRDARGRWRTMLDGGLFYSRGGFELTLRQEDQDRQ